MNNRILVYILLILCTGIISAKDAAGGSADSIRTVKKNMYLNEQASVLLGQVDTVLNRYSPAWPEPPERKSALLLLDGVLHEEHAAGRVPVQRFLKKRIVQALTEITQTDVTAGMRIWKLYNHGFFIRTGTVTVGFDLVDCSSVGIEGFTIAPETMNGIIGECDALFISHLHRDHVKDRIVQAFVEQGKPVVAPVSVLKDQPCHGSITHLERTLETVHSLPVQNGTRVLKVVVFPGHQADLENNVYIVTTPEGLTVAHMGDQFNWDDLKAIDGIGSTFTVDVLLPNCWTMDIVRVAAGIKPACIITGHENEMGHPVDQREPYWLTYQRRQGSDRFGGKADMGYDTPLVLMTWGESYLFRRENFIQR